GVNVAVAEQNAVVRRSCGWFGFCSDLPQALRLDLGQVKGAHVRARGAGFRADPSAPACPYNSDPHLLHGLPLVAAILQRITCRRAEPRTYSASSAVLPHPSESPLRTRQ